MEPVKFELIAEDKTKSATDSAEQNVDALNLKIGVQKTLIQGIQEDIARLQKEAAKGTGLRSMDEFDVVVACFKVTFTEPEPNF